MNIKHLILAAAATISVPALAQTAPEPFNGPFAGVEAGYQNDRVRVEVNGLGDTRETADGFRYGAFVGYDFKLSPTGVLGLEVGVSDSTGEIDDLFGSGIDARFGRTIDVTARAGAMVSPTSLLYARGGYTNARFSDAAGGDEGGENRDGWLIGGGFESMLGTNVSARVEYNYSQFSAEDDLDVSISPRRHVVKAGLAFRF